MEQWARRITTWHAGGIPPESRRISSQSPPRRKERDVYVYFDNDSGGLAPRQALDLIKLLDSGRTGG